MKRLSKKTDINKGEQVPSINLNLQTKAAQYLVQQGQAKEGGRGESSKNKYMLFLIFFYKSKRKTTIHCTWANLNQINCLKSIYWNKQANRNKRQPTRKARNPILGAHNDKNHCRLIKANDNQPLSEDRLENKVQDPNHRSGQRHISPQPKQANHFSMQAVNNPSKKTQGLLKKHKMWSTEELKQATQHS